MDAGPSNSSLLTDVLFDANPGTAIFDLASPSKVQDICTTGRFKTFRFLQQTLTLIFWKFVFVENFKDEVPVQGKKKIGKCIQDIEQGISLCLEMLPPLIEKLSSFCKTSLEVKDLEVDREKLLTNFLSLTEKLEGITFSNNLKEIRATKKILWELQVRLLELKKKMLPSEQVELDGLSFILREVIRNFRIAEVNTKAIQKFSHKLMIDSQGQSEILDEEVNAVKVETQAEPSLLVMASDYFSFSELKLLQTVQVFQRHPFKFETQARVLQVYLSCLQEESFPEISLEDFPLLVDLALTSEYRGNRSLLSCCQNRIKLLFDAHKKNNGSLAFFLRWYLEKVINCEALKAISRKFIKDVNDLLEASREDIEKSLEFEIEENPTAFAKELEENLLILLGVKIDRSRWRKLLDFSFGFSNALKSISFWHHANPSFRKRVQKEFREIYVHLPHLPFESVCIYYYNLLNYLSEDYGVLAHKLLSQVAESESFPNRIPQEMLLLVESFEYQFHYSLMRRGQSNSLAENLRDDEVPLVKALTEFLNQSSALLKALESKLKSKEERRHELEEKLIKASNAIEVMNAFKGYLNLFNPSPKDDPHFSLVEKLFKAASRDSAIYENSKELYKAITEIGKIGFSKDDKIETPTKVILPFCFYNSRFMENKPLRRLFPLATSCAVAYHCQPQECEKGHYAPVLKFLFYSEKHQNFATLFSKFLNMMWQEMNDEMELALAGQHSYPNSNFADNLGIGVFSDEAETYSTALREVMAPSIIFNVVNLTTLLATIELETPLRKYLVENHPSAYARICHLMAIRKEKIE